MTAEEPQQRSVSARIWKLAETIGPATLATALLFYFGFVATRARYAYFGVPLEMTGLTNQNLMLHGMEVVFVPAAMLFLGALALVGIHTLVLWQLSRSEQGTGSEEGTGSSEGSEGTSSSVSAFLAYAFVLVGVLLIARALIGIFIQGPDASVVIGPTPLALAFGPVAVAYGVWIRDRQRESRLLPQHLARNGVLFVLALTVAGLFWASTQLAWAYGKGRGEEDAADLRDRPEVVVDTRDPLEDLPAGVIARRLGAAGASAGAFRHRYEGFRLLLASDGRLFLVTPDWVHGRDRTVVLPYDRDIRVQLKPQP